MAAPNPPAKKEADASHAPSRLQRLKPALFALGLLVVGAGGGAGAATLLGGSTAEAGEHGAGTPDGEAEAGHEEATEDPHAPAPDAGGHGAPAEAPRARKGDRAVVTLGGFTVNLRGGGGGRMLRTEVQLEIDASQASQVEARHAALRDAVITLASDYAYADLEGIDGKTHLRDEMLGRVNGVLGSDVKVARVYFTEFVVQ